MGERAREEGKGLQVVGERKGCGVVHVTRATGECGSGCRQTPGAGGFYSQL